MTAAARAFARALWLIARPTRNYESAYGWVDALPPVATLAAVSTQWWRGLDWPWWCFTGALAFALLALHAAWRQQLRLDAIERQPQPNVAFDGFAPVPDQPVKPRNVSQSNIAEFVRARFINEPKQRGPGASVPDLHASIEFRDEEGEHVIMRVPDARWADTFDRGEAPSLYTKSVPIPGTGESRILDIAMQIRNEGACYGWDHNGVQIIDYPMPPGVYQIYVELDGSNMDKRHFRFTLKNNGAGDYLELTEAEGFDNPCSSRWLRAKSSTPNEANS